MLLDPDGKVVATADKQMLMGNERASSWARGAERRVRWPTPPSARWGCTRAWTGVTFEECPARSRCAVPACCVNSLNSFALDEARLHIPVRAVENGMFVVAANKGRSIAAHRTGAGVQPGVGRAS